MKLFRIGPLLYIGAGTFLLILVLSGNAWNDPRPVSKTFSAAGFAASMILFGLALLLAQNVQRPLGGRIVAGVAVALLVASIAAFSRELLLVGLVAALLIAPALVARLATASRPGLADAKDNE